MACATKFFLKNVFFFLNKGNNNEKKNLYRKIVNLQFAEYESNFLVDWKTVINSQGDGHLTMGTNDQPVN